MRMLHQVYRLEDVDYVQVIRVIYAYILCIVPPPDLKIV
eukprot:SAG11_NODE_30887_length_296_cov_1.609137_1_plen_38_part_01